jgi:6-phosphogluconate dehydrogenase (decarboxylating)
MKSGFIGLGNMGSRMAANLQKCGHCLVIHNRTPQKAEPLLAKGADWADSPADLAPCETHCDSDSVVRVRFLVLSVLSIVGDFRLALRGWICQKSPVR